MQSDWSVACGAEDPMVVVPWACEDDSIHYIDLRESPARVDEIPEAANHLCVASALRRWNQPSSSLFTAKCDIWHYPADLFDADDLPDFAHAHGSYIDLLSADPNIFTSFSTSEMRLRGWSEAARSIPLPEGRCEWTLRPSRIFSGERSTDGFATTLYVWGYGSSPLAAANAWSAALLALIEPVLLQRM